MIGKRIRKTERVGKRKGTPVEFLHPFCLWLLKNFSSHIFRRGWFGITSPILYLQQILFRIFHLKFLLLQAMKTLDTYMKMRDPASVVVTQMQMDNSVGLKRYTRNYSRTRITTVRENSGTWRPAGTARPKTWKEWEPEKVTETWGKWEKREGCLNKAADGQLLSKYDAYARMAALSLK